MTSLLLRTRLGFFFFVYSIDINKMLEFIQYENDFKVLCKEARQPNSSLDSLLPSILLTLKKLEIQAQQTPPQHIEMAKAKCAIYRQELQDLKSYLKKIKELQTSRGSHQTSTSQQQNIDKQFKDIDLLKEAVIDLQRNQIALIDMQDQLHRQTQQMDQFSDKLRLIRSKLGQAGGLLKRMADRISQDRRRLAILLTISVVLIMLWFWLKSSGKSDN